MRDKLRRMTIQNIISVKSKIIFVNDGSSDKTWKIISDLCRCDSIFSGLCFSRNYGHQSAILAGMMAAREHADMVVTIDADLQQDIEALDKFVKCYQEGCEIVYGVRMIVIRMGCLKSSAQTCFTNLCICWDAM